MLELIKKMPQKARRYLYIVIAMAIFYPVYLSLTIQTLHAEEPEAPEAPEVQEFSLYDNPTVAGDEPIEDFEDSAVEETEQPKVEDVAEEQTQISTEAESKTSEQAEADNTNTSTDNSATADIAITTNSEELEPGNITITSKEDDDITFEEDIQVVEKTDDEKVKKMTIRRTIQTGTATAEMEVMGYIDATPIRIVVPIKVICDIDQDSTDVTSSDLYIKNEGTSPIRMRFEVSEIDENMPIIPPDTYDDWENLNAEQSVKGIALGFKIGEVDYWLPQTIEIELQPGEEQNFKMIGKHGKVFKDAIEFTHKFRITADLE